MARVQGTIVALEITFDSQPPDVQVAVQPPTGALTVAKHSTGGVAQPDPNVPTFTYSIDTSPMAGAWSYEVASLGGSTNVRKLRTFDVRPKIGP